MIKLQATCTYHYAYIMSECIDFVEEPGLSVDDLFKKWNNPVFERPDRVSLTIFMTWLIWSPILLNFIGFYVLIKTLNLL